MVNGFEHMKRFAAGARALMEEGHVDSAAGRYSRTLFMSVSERGSDLEAAARGAAAVQGWNLVTLEFGHSSKAKGPQAITVSMNNADGDAEIIHDCALVRDGDRHVIVPPAATFHFAIGADGLERRHGRPANIAAGRIQAGRDLTAAAKRADPESPCMEAHTYEIAS
ncbi:MAG: hypothetical protein EOP62_11630 [Sphingomonadales bacterium]|nr:MAG: hypothetical protein EOP62_11630 [Sphingomonadales bacterium]